MKELQGGLAHYRRERFFYLLFLRKSPRNAALFGLGWCLFFASLIFLVHFLINPYLTRISHAAGLAAICWVGSILLWIYGFAIFGYAIAAMVRSCYPGRKVLPLLGIFGGFFYPLGILVLLLVLIRRKQPFFAGLCMIGFAGFVTAWSLALMKMADASAIWWINWGSLALFFLSILGFRDRKKVRPFAFIPLACLLLYECGVGIYIRSIDDELSCLRSDLSRQLGHSVELKNYWLDQKTGIPVWEEPLKSMISHVPKERLRWSPLWNVSTCRIEAERFRKENPEFVRSLDAFLRLPVGRIGHRAEDETLSSLLLPELEQVRSAGQYLAVELAAFANDRPKVLQYNAELERLRDWMLADPYLISTLVATVVERERLNALAAPLAAGTLNDSDWKEILDRKIDWNVQFADAVGSEVACFQSFYESILTHGNTDVLLSMEAEKPVSRPWLELFPMSIEQSIAFRQDYRFGLKQYRFFLGLFLDRELTAVDRFYRFSREIPEERFGLYRISSIMLPELGQLFLRAAIIEDRRRMVEVAVTVEQYRRKHGTLPESLDFLPTKPLDSLNRLPFVYQHGRLEMKDGNGKPVKRYGFRLYAQEADGTDPGGLKAEVAFVVLLSEPEE